ncbi:MAG TPA: DUF3800 domain-containing protein [Candidatus Angelobacter sp.]|jgi:hypothetical protein|nr:DUF3800 domain-containing protein [Candidatus Angelobacter sp.]
MKEAEDKPRWFFVDECGSPHFYEKKTKRLIVGEEGCSYTFGVGFLRTYDPQQIRAKLAEVRMAIAHDRYLKDIPSIKKSVVAFHAKDDCSEVRKMVFEALDKMDFGAQVVMARKIEIIFKSEHGGSQDRFYDCMVEHMFSRQLHLSIRNHITFARRGNKARQHALRAAVDSAARRFKRSHKSEDFPVLRVETSQPVQEPVLQATDYVLWAVQRAFEKGEMRYFEYLREKIELVWDIYDLEKLKIKGQTIYDRRKNPFHVEKISEIKKPAPLAKTP